MRLRSVPFIVLALTSACGSSTSPDPGALSGTWSAASATLPAGVRGLSFTLVQTSNTISGTGQYSTVGGFVAQLHVTGQAGLDGSRSCFPVGPSSCHVNFELQATDASGDTIFYQGQFAGSNALQGDVNSTNALPFWNVDYSLLQFNR